MKNLSKIDVIVSALVVILVIAVATVFGALQVTGAIKFNVHPLLLMLTILTLGVGLYVAIFGIVRNGGYEYAVGGILFVMGVILLMVCLKLRVWLIVIIGVGLGLIAMVIPFILKADKLYVQRTNESPDYVPYTEKIKEKEEN